MSQLDQFINDLLSIEGATGAAIVDTGSGMVLAEGGSPGFDMNVAGAGMSNVVRAKLRTMQDLGMGDRRIDDILTTLDQQYHLVNVLKGESAQGLFVYVVLNKDRANLALARHKIQTTARMVTV